ncbi:MAG: hypothetical protein EBT83_06645, partial [Betaproteobacteria bacterium]|nr:hypothetical protein [Betaproteobacteria bacterium]
MGADFVKAFGSGPFSLVFNGGQASVQGTNGKSGTYDIVTGQITWTATVTTPGQPVSTTETGAGTAIDQAHRRSTTRKLRQAGIVLLRLQFGALGGELFHRLLLA